MGVDFNQFNADAAARVQATRRRPSVNPSLEIGTFSRALGGVDEVVDQMVNERIRTVRPENGMTVSSRLVDGEIAAIPAFRGPSVSFDRNTFLGVLAQRKLNERIVRKISPATR
ncbi:MAG: SurA N-terminal domain-containing protein [Sphingomonadales bacterium]|nr:SurA N-terminal domain-containing protein [Sphingomonadales bacterium]